jgi:hypothetical protein
MATTPVLEEVAQSLNWQDQADYALLTDIHRLLTQLVLQPGTWLARIDVSDVIEYDPHTVPQPIEDGGLVDVWSDEVGRLRSRYLRCRNVQDHAGLADAHAWADSGQERYQPDEEGFRLLGPSDLDGLGDAFEWHAPRSIAGAVGVADFRRNCHLIGASEIRPPRRGSHYKVYFPRARSWTLDVNTDPIPTRFLAELVPIAGMSLDCIISTLLTGEPPSRALRLDT